VAAFVLAWSWWATNRIPFSLEAYAVVALPVAVCAAGALVAALRLPQVPSARGGAPGRGKPTGTSALWLVLLACSLALEGWALAAGGRSRRWPTLSDAVDDLLRWHGVRVLLYLAWLAVGLLIIRATSRHRSGVAEA